MQRCHREEMLDHDLGEPAEIAVTLVDLRRINRWFGGTTTTIALLQRVFRASGCSRLTLLEVGSGSGDAPLAAQRELAKQGLELEVVLLDRMWSHLPRNVASVAGDALRLPMRDDSFDVVSCNLLAHHFEPAALRAYAQEALRVCRRAVLINDLIRSFWHLGLVYLGLPLFRSRLTWHDAPLSVRRAYTREEMRELLACVPARRQEISWHYLYRMGVLLWK